MLKRLLAGLVIFIFIVVSLPTFLFFGISNTFLKTSFYQGQVADRAYDILVTATARKLLEKDEIIKAFFTESDLKADIMAVFPVGLFKAIITDVTTQVENVKNNNTGELNISIKVFRESLLTLANNLSFKLFQKLPICMGGQSPENDLKGLPTCIPDDAEYNEVAAPFTRRFESAVDMAFHDEKIKVDLNASLGQEGVTIANMVKGLSYVKNVLFAVLLTLLVLIAILIYKPFSLIMQYEGIAFAFAGITGYLLSLGLGIIPRYLVSKDGFDSVQPEMQEFTVYIMSYVIAESQKIAMTFLALGAVLILIRVFLKQKYHNEGGNNI
jgi:hypothetical protein